MISNNRFLLVSVLSAVVAACLAGPVAAQVPPGGQVGISVGGNFETLDDVSGGETEVAFDSPFGFNLGLSYDQPLGTAKPLSSFSVRPAVVARRVGQYGFPASIQGDGAELLQGETFTLWMLEFPVDARYQIPVDTGPVSLYGLLGPQISFPRADSDFDAALKNVSYSVNIGAGGEFELPYGLTVMPELRYELGVTDAFEDEFSYRFRSFSINNSPNFGGPTPRVHVAYQI